MEKYLITGASGFVGFHFINYLNSVVKEKTSVLGLDISEPKDLNEWNFENLEIKFKKINILDKTEVNNVIVDYEPGFILHLAALSSVGRSWNDPAGCFINNTGIFLNLIEAVRNHKLNSRILCIGSSEEYGIVEPDNIPISEDLNINPSNPYAVSKVAQESLCRCYVAKYGMNINLTRSFNHIGPRQNDTFVIASFCKQIASAFVKGEKTLKLTTGNLNVIRDFLDVRDVVSAYYLILQKGKSGELYNVCSGNGYGLNDIINYLGDISGLEISTVTNPDFIRPNDMPVIIGNNKKLKSDTGWEPVFHIKESLTDIFNYWVEQLKGFKDNVCQK